MDELGVKFLILGLALVLALFILLGSLLFLCHRHKRRRIHMAKMELDPNTLFDSPASYHKKSPQLSKAVADEKATKNGFAQVFHGSPTLPKKTYEAPPPPPVPSPRDDSKQMKVSPYGGGDPNNNELDNIDCSGLSKGNLCTVISIDNDESESIGPVGTLTSSRPRKDTPGNGHQISPGSMTDRPDKLTLKNRPFKISELPDLKEEQASPTGGNGPPRENVLKDLPKDSPLTVRRFPNKMEKLAENENEMLYYEFDILNQESQTSIRPRSTTSELNENIRKNRFYDILPYDFNRVKLKNRGDKSDYINASYINTDDGSLSYIAAQGPIGETESASGRRVDTVADFWYMAWQENIETIIMLTQCSEGVRQKCAMYWPENAGESIQVGGDMKIDLYQITEDEICFQRELWLTKGDSPKRKIVQWHYKDWKDAAGPQDAENLLTFMETIRAQEKESKSEKRPPLLVHCSAGVGRTGVYIAVDILLEKLQRENMIDIFDTVSRLREARTSMVQNAEQYLTVYEVIALAIRKRQNTNSRNLSKMKEKYCLMFAFTSVMLHLLPANSSLSAIPRYKRSADGTVPVGTVSADDTQQITENSKSQTSDHKLFLDKGEMLMRYLHAFNDAITAHPETRKGGLKKTFEMKLRDDSLNDAEILLRGMLKIDYEQNMSIATGKMVAVAAVQKISLGRKFWSKNLGTKQNYISHEQATSIVETALQANWASVVGKYLANEQTLYLTQLEQAIADAASHSEADHNHDLAQDEGSPAADGNSPAAASHNHKEIRLRNRIRTEKIKITVHMDTIREVLADAHTFFTGLATPEKEPQKHSLKQFADGNIFNHIAKLDNHKLLAKLVEVFKPERAD
ncbi:protein-tyrosine phosphatase domain-containing protein [Ditylenchus destructor]|nr:protein-tyrosine phosphatase domain-containing protein [Ditylenchus destructor]